MAAPSEGPGMGTVGTGRYFITRRYSQGKKPPY